MSGFRHTKCQVPALCSHFPSQKIQHSSYAITVEFTQNGLAAFQEFSQMHSGNSHCGFQEFPVPLQRIFKNSPQAWQEFSYQVFLPCFLGISASAFQECSIFSSAFQGFSECILGICLVTQHAPHAFQEFSRCISSVLSRKSFQSNNFQEFSLCFVGTFLHSRNPHRII